MATMHEALKQAKDAGFDSLVERKHKIEEAMAEELERANLILNGYRTQLETGGDPTVVPNASDEAAHKLWYLEPKEELAAMYRAWDDQRPVGRRNPHLPFLGKYSGRGYGRSRTWEIVEMVLAASEPVTYAALCESVPKFDRPTSPQVQEALFAVEKFHDGAYVARKTKVGGKVAFLIRERVTGDLPMRRNYAGNGVAMYADGLPDDAARTETAEVAMPTRTYAVKDGVLDIDSMREVR